MADHADGDGDDLQVYMLDFDMDSDEELLNKTITDEAQLPEIPLSDLVPANRLFSDRMIGKKRTHLQ